MIVKFGTHTHRNNEIGPRIERQMILDERQRPVQLEETWTLDGMLLSTASTEAAAIADIKSKVAALEAAYASSVGKDLIVYLPDGTTQTHMTLLEDDTLGGIVLVNGPTFNNPVGVEAVTIRTYTITLKAFKPVGDAADGANVILSFTEECNYEGGAPNWVMRRRRFGRPKKYSSNLYTEYRVIQQGRAVGLYTRPSIASPIWPTAQKGNPVITRGAPEVVRNNRQYNWPITWQYTFESAFQMIGTPHVWGLTYDV